MQMNPDINISLLCNGQRACLRYQQYGSVFGFQWIQYTGRFLSDQGSVNTYKRIIIMTISPLLYN